MLRQIMEKLPQSRLDGSWNYPLIAEYMWEARIEEIEMYIWRQQNTVEQYIVTRPIMDLYLEA